jgi:hypothetical protein
MKKESRLIRSLYSVRVCVCLSLSLSISLCVCISLCVSLSVSLLVCVSVCVITDKFNADRKWAQVISFLKTEPNNITVMNVIDL